MLLLYGKMVIGRTFPNVLAVCELLSRQQVVPVALLVPVQVLARALLMQVPVLVPALPVVPVVHTAPVRRGLPVVAVARMDSLP